MESIHHLAIQVDNIRQALAWYQGEFDVEVTYEDESWAMIRFANVSLALVLPGHHPPHFAVSRKDAGLYGPLNRHRDGTASVYVADPFGNVIEFIQLPE